MYKNKLKIEDVPILIFVFNTYHASFRVMYGFHKDGLLMLVYGNASGVPLGILLFSVFIYKKYADSKLTSWSIIIGFLIVLGGVACFVLLFLNKQHKYFTGFTGSTFTFLLFTGPLTKSVSCWKKKNHNIIPLFYTIMAFCVALFWGLYALGKRDVVVMASNGPGVLVTGGALTIKTIVYLTHNIKEKEESDVGEENEEEEEEKPEEKMEEESEISKIIEIIGDQMVPQPIIHEDHNSEYHHKKARRNSSSFEKHDIEMAQASLGEHLVDEQKEKKERSSSFKKAKNDITESEQIKEESNRHLNSETKLINEERKEITGERLVKESDKLDHKKEGEENKEIDRNRI